MTEKKRKIAAILACCMTVSLLPAFSMRAEASGNGEEDKGREVTLRVSNWEEYIDLGGWDEEETGQRGCDR